MIGLKAPFLACLLVIAGGFRLSVAARVEYERAVERARYPFVLGATKPFDEVYPRSLFEQPVGAQWELGNGFRAASGCHEAARG